MRKKSKKLQGFYTLLLSYFCILLFPCLLLIVFVQHIYIQQMDNYITDTAQKKLNITVSELDFLFGNMDAAANSIYMDADFGESIRPNNFISTQRIKSKLNMLTTSQKYLTEIVIYQNGSDYLFSSYSSYTKNSFLNVYHLEDMSQEQFYDYLTSETQHTLNASKGTSNYKVFHQFGKGIKDYISIVFIIDIEKVNAVMLEQLVNSTGVFYIEDSAGNLFTLQSSGTEQDADFYQDIIHEAREEWPHNTKQGSSIIPKNGVNYVVAEKTSDINGYRFITVTSGDPLSEQIKTQKILWTVLVVLLLFSGTILVLYFSRLIYRPIKQIKQKAERIYGIEETKDCGVYDLINSSLEYLDEKSSVLQEQMNNYRKYLISKILRNELHTSEECSLAYNLLNFDTHNSLLYVTVIKTDYICSEEEITEYLLSCKLGSVHFVVRELEGGQHFVALWTIDDVDAQFIRLQLDALLKTGGICKITASEKIHDIGQVSAAFIKVSVLDEMTGSQHGIFWFDNERTKQIPVAECTHIQEQIKAGNLDEAEASLIKLLNLGNEKELYWDKYICMYLAYILSDVNIHFIKPVEKADILLLLKNRDKSFYHLYLEELIGLFSKEIDRQQKQAPVNKPVIEKMKHYLEEHYDDPNFSFQQMAEEYGMTLPALSKFFHEKSGMIVNDYVTELKISRAKYLLENTEIAAAEIAREVGYYNAGSFSRRFRQITGQSPTEYRKKMRDLSQINKE